MRVCHINVNVTEFRPLSPAERDMERGGMQVPRDATVVLFSARLAPQKGVTRMLAMAKTVCARTADVLFLVAGDGSLHALVDAAADRLAGCLRFLGAVDPALMPAIMGLSDVLLLPSSYEGVASALYEAMASGVAVLATDVGGQSELLVSGVNGILVSDDRNDNSKNNHHHNHDTANKVIGLSFKNKNIKNKTKPFFFNSLASSAAGGRRDIGAAARA